MRRIAEWRSGRARSLRSPAALDAFEGMLPALLRAIAGSADPDNALNRLSDVVERVPSGVNLYRLLEARPGLSTLLARILAHAPALADQLARRPALMDSLLDSSCFDPPPAAADFAAFLTAEMRGKPYDLAIDRARRIVNERRFALGVQLVDRRDDPLSIGRGYANVAEGALVALAGAAVAEFEAAHGRLAGAELVVIGLGRLGGQVLTSASDLDLIYLFTDPSAEVSDGDEAARPRRLLQPPRQPGERGLERADRRRAAVRGRHPAPAARRAGDAGGVARSVRRLPAKRGLDLGAYGAGPGAAGVRVGRRARTGGEPDRSILKQPRDRARVVADAIRMREEIATHKAPSGPLDVKLGPGGLVDLEFAVHVLQLTRGEGLDPRLESAVEAAGAGEPRPGKCCRSATLAHADARRDPAAGAGDGDAQRRQPRADGRAVRGGELGRFAWPPRPGAAEHFQTVERGKGKRMINEGDRAPALDIHTSDGRRIDLADLGGPVVLYFYPKDDTSGCTREAQDFTELAAEFEGDRRAGRSASRAIR